MNITRKLKTIPRLVDVQDALQSGNKSNLQKTISSKIYFLFKSLFLHLYVYVFMCIITHTPSLIVLTFGGEREKLCIICNFYKKYNILVAVFK